MAELAAKGVDTDGDSRVMVAAWVVDVERARDAGRGKVVSAGMPSVWGVLGTALSSEKLRNGEFGEKQKISATNAGPELMFGSAVRVGGVACDLRDGRGTHLGHGLSGVPSSRGPFAAEANEDESIKGSKTLQA